MLKPKPGINAEEFRSNRRAEGLEIDAATAEVTWVYAQMLDPYGIFEVPDENISQSALMAIYGLTSVTCRMRRVRHYRRSMST
jgi:hypothetical protein